jgi:hypothetical protein
MYWKSEPGILRGGDTQLVQAANIWTQFALTAKQSIHSPERPVLFSITTRLELRFLGKTTPPGTAKLREKSHFLL